ncbi:MAG: homoserine dehydrogenase, partial [Flavobacteriales bacterium]
FDKVYTEGITKLTKQDVEYAEQLGYRIKHLGIARRTADGIELRVHPTLIPEQRLIANVNGVKNAVLVQSDAVGPTLYFGAGAGAGPTASAVVADVVDLVRMMTAESAGAHVPHLAFQPDALSDTPILAADQMTTGYYLRIDAEDTPGVLANVTGILSGAGINIDAILQKPAHTQGRVPVVLITQPVREQRMNQAIVEIEALQAINSPVMRIRLENLDG